MSLIVDHPEAEQRQMRERLLALADRFSALPVLDPRSPDELVGYDEDGLPS